MGNASNVRRKHAWVSEDFLDQARRIESEVGRPIPIHEFSEKIASFTKQQERRLARMFSDKRGTITDFVFVFVLLMVTLMSVLVFMQVGIGVMDNPSFVEQVNTSQAASTALYQWSLFRDGGLDNMFVTGYFLIHLLVIVLATLLPIFNTAFMVINLIYVVIVGLLAGIFQDVFLSILTSFGTTNFSKTLFILNHFFAFEVGFMLVMLFVLYMVRKEQ